MRLDGASVFKYPRLMRPDEQPTPEQIAAWQGMSGEDKLKIADQLYRLARTLKAAGLQNQHPDWTPERIEAKVVEIFVNART
jgi:aldehyde:ferredoxin oxidoreductase